MKHPQAPGESTLTNFDKRVAYGLMLLVVFLEVLGLWATGGHPSGTERLAMLVGFVLLVGLAFYLLTRHSQGELHLKEAGLRLGGPAAVGLLIVLILDARVFRVAPLRVLSLQSEESAALLDIDRASEGIRLTLVGERVLVEFDEGVRSGWIITRRLNDARDGWRYERLDFERTGSLRRRALLAEEIPS